MFRWVAILIPFICFADLEPWKTESEEEALFLRRIVDFWEEEEYEIAKGQMEEFFAAFPESAFKDPLSIAMGDLLLREKNYTAALNCYAQLDSAELTASVFLNRMQCLYHMQWYATLADECEKKLQEQSLDGDQKLQTIYFLAIALYRQCLNAAQEPEILAELAKRAEPYFNMLFESSLSDEVAEGFAHLCCILKDYSKASQIYLELAEKDPENAEEMLFQAALIAAEHDKERACIAFDELAKKGGKKATEATYNRLVLEFELGHFQQLLEKKEEFLKAIPEDRIPLAHFFFGKSLFALQKYPEALAELQVYLANASVSDTMRAGLFLVFETAAELSDLAAFDAALSAFCEHYPSDPESSKGFFLRAQLLKRLKRYEEAQKEIESLLDRDPETPLYAAALFERAYLDYETKSWLSCSERLRQFLSRYPAHDLASFAWRYLASSTAELNSDQLANVLEQLLQRKELFSRAECLDWQFLLAKAHFDQKRYREAFDVLEHLVATEELFSQKPNAFLLLAFCYRDGKEDLTSFCSLAEQALAQNADWIDLGSLHASLFNAYLEQEQFAKAADHLFCAFEKKAEIQVDNLLWLVETYAALPGKTEQIAIVLEFLLQLPRDPLFAEPLTYQLAEVYGLLGKSEKQIALLESLLKQYSSHPELTWTCEKKAFLLLGEAYAARGEEDRALFLFDAILASSSNVRSKTCASASLQSVRLHKKKEQPDWTKLLGQLKDLVLQKTVQNEPLHLEAAMEYVELQTFLSPSKRLSLWLKAKRDFERTDDLLSKDYCETRTRFPQINAVIQDYLHYMEAEILLAQAEANSEKELQAKAKDFLLQIIDQNAHPALIARAKKRLDAIEK